MSIQHDLLAIASHELRTPLGAIAAWVRLLRSRQLDSEKSEHAFDVIEQSIRTQVALIDDILDVSRILNANFRMQMQEVDILAIMRSTIDLVSPEAERKQIQLLVASTPNISPVIADTLRLQRAFTNLLSNAIKFTDPGGKVLIEVSRNDSHVEINVTDTGRGIEPEFLPFIFNRFFQCETVPGSNEGLGLGLAIVREIIELHHGSFSAYSEGNGKGATFTIRLPFQIKEDSLRKIPEISRAFANTSNIG